MVYFILWVVFLLFLVLSIPVAAMLENRQQRARLASMNDDHYVGDAESHEETDGGEPVNWGDAEGYGGEDDLGGDAFA